MRRAEGEALARIVLNPFLSKAKTDIADCLSDSFKMLSVNVTRFGPPDEESKLRIGHRIVRSLNQINQRSEFKISEAVPNRRSIENHCLRLTFAAVAIYFNHMLAIP